MIKEIVTHGSPAHLDEILGAILLWRHGEDEFPGVMDAEFRTLAKGESVEKLTKRKDVILLGVGRGLFDEHGLPEEQRSKECCATLVAKHLGLDNDPRWSRILNDVLHTDKNPPNLALHLSRTVMLLQKHWALSEVVQHAEDDIRAAWMEQKEFFQVNLMDIERHEFNLWGGESWIAVIRKPQDATVRMARYEGAAIVVIRHPDDHTQILATNSFALDMRDIVRILRIKEAGKKGIESKDLPQWRYLEDQECDEVTEWFFHRDSNNVMNGSKSRPDIPPTRLSLDEILSAIELGLERTYEPTRQQTCETGQCSSTPQDLCPLYDLGLIRCRAIRSQAHRNGNGGNKKAVARS
ncbi:MAG: hypothetical protein KJI69_02985 [Patescibacteria group bacterium]|nr:hypothetical protein [Patescibacteria group bacterium]